jgi:hypothetical protein
MKKHWIVPVLWLMPIWAVALIILSVKWLATDDPGWLAAIFGSFFAGYYGRRLDAKAGKFCMIFAGVIAAIGFLIPINVCR